jgi:hypothetical protein
MTAITDIPQRERPLSEQFRIVAKSWVQADASARFHEEFKTTKLEQLKQALIESEGDMPDSHAERRVKSSPDWESFIREMVDARTDANLKKAQMQFLQMRFTEWQDANASQRAEMRLSR